MRKKKFPPRTPDVFMEKFYVTTAIPYVNARPHIGHALLLVNGDVIARCRRLEGYDVRFSAGTDEHGVKNVRAAEKVGMSIRQFVGQNALAFQNLLHELNISNDDFIRTSDKKRHFPGAQKLWRLLVEKGDIYKGFYKGLYCVGHEAFITEKDLVHGKCVEHDAAPEIIEEENYFFRLSRYAKELQKFIESDELRIIPEARKNEALAFIKGGLDDISFSRPAKDLSWGVPVPGDDAHTMYVWCDALSNYISSLGYGSDDETTLQKYWPADVQVIGKDILRFHAVFWPAMLLSAGLPLPKSLFVHGFINIGGKKMSKTIGNVADPMDLIQKYGADAVRFYLLHEISTFSDGNFTHEQFAENYEAHLVNGIGNLLSRTIKMIQLAGGALKKPTDDELIHVPFRSILPVFDEAKSALDPKKLETHLVSAYINTRAWPAYRHVLQNYDLHAAIHNASSLADLLDRYIQDWKPFELLKTDPEKARAVLWTVVNGLLNFAWMIEPFMPTTADKIFQTLGVSKDDKEWSAIAVREAPHLFPRTK